MTTYKNGKWDKKDEEILKKEYYFQTAEQLAILLNRTVKQIYKKASSLKLKRQSIPSNELNLLNKKFNKLLVIEKSETKDHKTFWKCQCDCGNIYIGHGSLIVSGRVKSCGCLITKTRSRKWSGYGEISGKYWRRIVSNAKHRNIELKISKEYIWELFLVQERRCALSGQELYFPKKQMVDGSECKNQTASLDRIDSSKGYIVGNVQWIHKDINQMKMDCDNQYFIETCIKICNNNTLINKTKIDDLNEKFDYINNISSEQLIKKKSSIYRGVHKSFNRWYATIYYDKKKHFIGGYSSEVEAAEAYNKKAKEILKENATLNNI